MSATRVPAEEGPARERALVDELVELLALERRATELWRDDELRAQRDAAVKAMLDRLAAVDFRESALG